MGIPGHVFSLVQQQQQASKPDPGKPQKPQKPTGGGQARLSSALAGLAKSNTGISVQNFRSESRPAHRREEEKGIDLPLDLLGGSG